MSFEDLPFTLSTLGKFCCEYKKFHRPEDR